MNNHHHYPASVSAIIFNDRQQILLVSPVGVSAWQVVTGWLEQETVVEGILREVREELGDLTVQVLDILDAHRFEYQPGYPLISIWALVKYIGGEITPQDDIQGYHWRWFDWEALPGLDIVCPEQFELLEKAYFLMRLYQDDPSLPFLKFKWQSIT